VNRIRSLILLIAVCAPVSWAQYRYLKTNQFPNVPKPIQEKLAAMGCEIPQSSDNSEPHNILKGQFAAAGQWDWAVVCSKNKQSILVILWGGPAQCDSKPWGPYGDKETSEGLNQPPAGPKKYFLTLEKVSAKFLNAHAEYQELKLPKGFTHDALGYSFPELGGHNDYCYNGKWVELGYVD
jgi:hypothetical protein